MLPNWTRPSAESGAPVVPLRIVTRSFFALLVIRSVTVVAEPFQPVRISEGSGALANV